MLINNPNKSIRLVNNLFCFSNFFCGYCILKFMPASIGMQGMMDKLWPFRIDIIFHMHFICFRFCLMCSKLNSIGVCLWGKQHHNAIYFTRNLEIAWCTVRHSCSKLQYEDFRVFGCQSKGRFIFMFMKTKHPVHIMVLEMVTSNGDVMPPFVSQHGFWLNTEAYIKCLMEVVLPLSRGWLLEDPTSGKRTLRHA